MRGKKAAEKPKQHSNFLSASAAKTYLCPTGNATNSTSPDELRE